jgi:acyl-CoA reductase-like NAD-dependent aldehyde dehydrogenase
MAVATIRQRAEDLATAPLKMLIGGRFVEAATGETFDTPNPATGEILATVAKGGPEDIDRAVAAAREAFESGPWTTMTPSERGRILHRLGDLIMENVDVVRRTALAGRHADLSERRGLTEHDLRVGDWLDAQVARARRVLEALESVREEA